MTKIKSLSIESPETEFNILLEPPSETTSEKKNNE